MAMVVAGAGRKSAGTQRHDKTAAVNSGKKTSYEHRLKVEISQAVVAITTHEQLHFEFSSCSCRFPTPWISTSIFPQHLCCCCLLLGFKSCCPQMRMTYLNVF